MILFYSPSADLILFQHQNVEIRDHEHDCSVNLLFPSFLPGKILEMRAFWA